MAFNQNAKRLAIVDLVKNKVIKVSEQAAKGFVRTARFAWPEDVVLAIDATNDQKGALAEAIAFNNGEVLVLATGTDLATEKEKEAKEEAENPADEATKEYPNPGEVVLENLVIRELQVLAFENGYNLEGKTLKKDIIEAITEQIKAGE